MAYCNEANKCEDMHLLRVKIEDLEAQLAELKRVVEVYYNHDIVYSGQFMANRHRLEAEEKGEGV